VCVYCAARTGPNNCSTACATPQFLSVEHAMSQRSLCHTAVPVSRTRHVTAQSVRHRSSCQQNTPCHSAVCAKPQFLSADHAMSQRSLCHTAVPVSRTRHVTAQSVPPNLHSSTLYSSCDCTWEWRCIKFVINFMRGARAPVYLVMYSSVRYSHIGDDVLLTA
jgi:hypothetical protein